MNEPTIKQITSSEFRIKYQQLTEEYEVTQLGRPFGKWTPYLAVPFSLADLDKPLKIEFRPVPKPPARKKAKRL